MWRRTLLASIIASGVAAPATEIQAGPLVDFLLGRRYDDAAPYTAAMPVAVVPPYASNAAPLGGMNIPQSVVAALPAGGYQTVLNKVPTTYYRPVTSLDPVTGTTITTLQPCTSYQHQALRVPTLLPTAASPSYFTAYGTYGLGLAQNRFSPITGSTIAAAPGQSSLSIPSSFGTTTALSPAPVTAVQQLPLGGANVGAVTANYNSYAVALPTVAAPNPAVPSPVIPAASYPITANYQAYSNPTLPVAANYFSNPTAAAVSPGYTLGTPVAPSYPGGAVGASVTQPDGTIVTPLGPPTLTAAPVAPPLAAATPPVVPPVVPPPTAAPAPQPAYSSNFGSYDGAPQRYPDGTIVTPLGSSTSSASVGQGTADPPTLLQPHESYSPPAAQPYDPNCPESPVLPPASSVAPSGQGYPSQPYPSQPGPTEVYPPQSTAPAATGGYDAESSVQPTLPFTPGASSAGLRGEGGRMVAIDRPAANFSRRPLASDDSFGLIANESPRSETSPYGSLIAPALLPSGGGDAGRTISDNAIVAPRGVDPKPYWRSEQKSAVPDSLRSDGEKTASRSRGAETFIEAQRPTETRRPIESAAPIRWISQSSTAATPAAAEPAPTAAQSQLRPSTRGNYPAAKPAYDDGFRAAQ